MFRKGESKVYTPRTYGIHGLTFNEFDVDKILPAGSNLNAFMDEDVGLNSWLLLRFQILRLVLSLVHKVYGWLRPRCRYIQIPCGMAVQVTFQLSRPFLKINYGTKRPHGNPVIQRRKLSLGTAQKPPQGLLCLRRDLDTKIFVKPNHIAVILEYYQRVAPPPPDIPMPYKKATGVLVEPTEEELGRAMKARDAHATEELKHHEMEVARLLGEITDLILWCTLTESITQLLLYERTGAVFDKHSRLLLVLETKLNLYHKHSPGSPRRDIKLVSVGTNLTSKVVSVGNAEQCDADLDESGLLMVYFVQSTDSRRLTAQLVRKSLERPRMQVTQKDLDVQVSTMFGRPTQLLIFAGKSGRCTLDGFPACSFQDTIAYARKETESFDGLLYSKALRHYEVEKSMADQVHARSCHQKATPHSSHIRPRRKFYTKLSRYKAKSSSESKIRT